MGNSLSIARECDDCQQATKLHKVHGNVADAKAAASSVSDGSSLRDWRNPRENMLLRSFLDVLDLHPSPIWRRSDDLLLIFNHIAGVADVCDSVPGYSRLAAQHRLETLLPAIPSDVHDAMGRADAVDVLGVRDFVATLATSDGRVALATEIAAATSQSTACDVELPMHHSWDVYLPMPSDMLPGSRIQLTAACGEHAVGTQGAIECVGESDLMTVQMDGALGVAYVMRTAAKPVNASQVQQ